MKYIKDLLYWVEERENIRTKKEAGQFPPWTADPIMAENRWCNVRREHDKVTKFVTKWAEGHFLHTLPFGFCVARLVNWPDTLELLGYPSKGWDQDYRQHWLKVFGDLRAEGRKAWTGAYMVTGGFSKGGETKEVIIARVLDGAWERCMEFEVWKPNSLRDAATTLTTPGMGQFLVAQVLADLKNTPVLSKADDWWSWCAPGPGSTMGLNFIHDRPRTKALDILQFQEEVNKVREILQQYAGLILCAQNTQNCLCELSKYIRARYFGERLKNRYSYLSASVYPLR